MSKLTELLEEMCPEGVQFKPLKEVCKEFIVPQRDRPKVFGGEIPWCRIEDIEGQFINGSKLGLGVTKETIEAMNLRVCPEGTVLATCSASLGVVAIATQPLVTNQTFIGLVCGDELINKYLYYVLFTQERKLKSLASTGTIPYISRKKFEGLYIPVPPLEVQQEIVRLLDAFTDLEQNLVSELELRQKQFDLFKSDILHLSTTCASLTPLKEVGRWFGGGTPSKKNSAYWEEGDIPWISPKDMGGSVVRETQDYITSEAVSGSSAKLVPENSVAFVVRSSILNHTLPIAFVPVSATLNQDMKAVITREDIIPKYFYYALSAAREHILLTVRRRGGSVASLDNKKLREYEIPVPSLTMQQEIVDKLDAFEALIQSIEQEITLRRKQYEFYRDELLRFTPKEA